MDQTGVSQDVRQLQGMEDDIVPPHATIAPAMAVAHIAFFMALQPAMTLSACTGDERASDITSAMLVEEHCDVQAVRLAYAGLRPLRRQHDTHTKVSAPGAGD
jgi:hypothetical protein